MEEWRDIIGFEGRYQVSNLGRVKSLCNGEEWIKKGNNNGTGYLQVDLYKDGKRKPCTVHRLVATAFIPNPYGLPEVNHIDEDKTNNRADNLEWCNRMYNVNYGTGMRRAAESRGMRVYQYTLDGSFVRSYPSTNEAERRTGIKCVNICACCNNKPHYKSAGGYVWSYNPPTPTQTRVLF